MNGELLMRGSPGWGMVHIACLMPIHPSHSWTGRQCFGVRAAQTQVTVRMRSIKEGKKFNSPAPTVESESVKAEWHCTAHGQFAEWTGIHLDWSFLETDRNVLPTNCWRSASYPSHSCRGLRSYGACIVGLCIGQRYWLADPILMCSRGDLFDVEGSGSPLVGGQTSPEPTEIDQLH